MIIYIVHHLIIAVQITKKKRVQQLLHKCLHNTCSKTSPRHFIALCSVILRNTVRSNTKTGCDFACRIEHACATWKGNLQRERSVVGTANEIHLGRPSPTERNTRECLYQTSRGKQHERKVKPTNHEFHEWHWRTAISIANLLMHFMYVVFIFIHIHT